MIDYEILPEFAGTDGLMSIFPKNNPVSEIELAVLWQIPQNCTCISPDPNCPSWCNPIDEYRKMPWFLYCQQPMATGYFSETTRRRNACRL